MKILSAALCVFALLAASADEGGKIKVACIGDSITYGYAMTNRAEECYPVQLQKLLGDGYEVRNFGDPGAGVYLHLRRGQEPRAWRLRKEYEPALAFKPDIVVCNLGINDSEEFVNEYSRRADGKTAVERGLFRRQYADLLESFAKDGQRPRYVIWTKLGPTGKKHGLKGKPNAFLMEPDLEQVARAVGAETLDMFTPLAPFVETEHFHADGIHPEGGAQKVIADVTAAKILGGRPAASDFGGWQVPSWDPLLSAPEAIGRNVGGTWCGHVQGMCATSNALYFSLHNQIVKTDWLGRLVRRVEVARHCGDICHWKGRLYTGVWLEPKEKDGKWQALISVYDAETLAPVKSRAYDWDHGIDGITCMGGVLYVSLGMEDWKSTGHRNWFGKFDAETLEPVGKPFVVDHGEDSSCGVQNFTNDGTYLYANYYTIDEAAKTPCFIVFDKDFNVVGKHVFGWRQGLEAIPGGENGAVRFAYCTTVNWNWKHRDANPQIPVQALVQFAELKDGKIEDISRHCMFKKPLRRKPLNAGAGLTSQCKKN